MLAVRPILSDAREFISRLKIESDEGPAIDLSNPHPEQVLALEDFLDPEVELCVHHKCRQMGESTVKAAEEFEFLYTIEHPIKTLVVTDCDETTQALRRKYRFFHRTLPDELQRDLERSNDQEFTFHDTLAGVRTITAGGRGQGKGWTYQRLVCEEMAFWPHPEDTWASVTATQHEGPYNKTFIISTSNGPGNLYHLKVLEAQRAFKAKDPKVRFRFFPWFDHRTYRRIPPQAWEPTQEEHLLGEKWGLDWPQLYWRYWKTHGPKGIGEKLFRRHYPFDVEDGFAEFEGAWFNVELLQEIFNELQPKQGEVRVFQKPIPGIPYAAGLDPSWCLGKDYAVLQILSPDGKQVCCFSTNVGGEDRFARIASEILLRYNDARVLLEDNAGGGGLTMRKILQGEGRRLWRQPPDPHQRRSHVPKYWITGNANKTEAYAHLRQMVNGDALELLDWYTVQELMHIREENGVIEGKDGMPDDHADALYMAEWCRRTLPGERAQPLSFTKRRKARRVAWSAGR